MFTQYQLDNHPNLHPLLVAFLGQAGFDSFQETDAGLIAFGAAARHAEWTAKLDELAHQFDFSYTHRTLEDKNWNLEWESQFHPIAVGERLYIRADFHDPAPAGYDQELVITPKMAFGTGHHATTYMMCEFLFELDLVGKRVFDYGSGTGVLAILAKRLGAGPTHAVDIEEPAAESTLENAARNGIELDEVVHGTLEDVPVRQPYDLILANINRNVILATAGALYGRLAPGGTALFSGILAKDEQLLQKRLTELGFHHVETRRREDWRALRFRR